MNFNLQEKSNCLGYLKWIWFDLIKIKTNIFRVNIKRSKWSQETINLLDLNKAFSNIKGRARVVRRDWYQDLVVINNKCFKIGKLVQITNAKNYSDLVAMVKLPRPSSYPLENELPSRKWIIYSMTKRIAREFSVK